MSARKGYGMELTRKDKILKLIVEDFIKTAQPVGSNYLIDKYKLNLSSATIRNEMNQLEKEGLLEKTHTSSGRVPSTKGYKYYIDHFKTSKIDEKIKNQITDIFDTSSSVEEIMSKSCEILSHMTNLASAVLGPGADEEKLVSVQLVPINNSAVTAIFITDKGYVENKTFVMNGDAKIQDVKKTIEILNDRLVGTKISELVPKLEGIKPIISDYISDYTFIYNALLKTFYEFSSKRKEFYGKENLLHQPEFENDPNELKKIFGLIDSSGNKLESLLDKSNSNLLINCGEIDQNFDDVSVVSKEIVANGQNIGRIAIIGPTRMDYSKALNNLDYVAKRIMEHLNYEDIQEEDKDGE